MLKDDDFVISINPNELSANDNYKFLIGSVIPRPIALITTMSEKGFLNAAPFSYFNVVSTNPPLLAVSIGRRNGKMKDTSTNITKTKEFVIHIVDESIVDDMNETAATLPEEGNEIDLTSFVTIKSEHVNVPAIKQAKIRMECVLEKHVPLGDEPVSNDLIIGKVVQYHIKNDIYQDGKVDPLALAPVSRLAGHYYGNLGKIYEIERPK